jgi:hypothetical protein
VSAVPMQSLAGRREAVRRPRAVGGSGPWPHGQGYGGRRAGRVRCSCERPRVEYGMVPGLTARATGRISIGVEPRWRAVPLLTERATTKRGPPRQIGSTVAVLVKARGSTHAVAVLVRTYTLRRK